MRGEKCVRLRRLHRLFGMIAVTGVFWLAITGGVLLYDDPLGLARLPLPNWLTRLYGGSVATTHLAAAGHRLGYDGHWQFDGRAVAVTLHAPQQFLLGPAGLYYGVADDGIVLFMADGTLVEAVSAAAFGSTRLTRAGGNEQIICAGDTLLRCSRDGAEWQPAAANLPPLTPVAAAAAELPSFERLFLDLHAGRFLGPAQKVVWTIFDVALLFLAWSGLRMALRRRH